MQYSGERRRVKSRNKVPDNIVIKNKTKTKPKEVLTAQAK